MKRMKMTSFSVSKVYVKMVVHETQVIVVARMAHSDVFWLNKRLSNWNYKFSEVVIVILEL